MKVKTLATVIFILIGITCAKAQEKKWVNPIIKNYGGIMDLDKVDVAPDPDMEYKILIELVHKIDKSAKRAAFPALNVARLINLHAVGGVKPENLKVAVVIHGGATNSVLSEEAFKKKYKTDSHYAPLYKELMEAGVEVIVCGQSYVSYGNSVDDLLTNVRVGTSALTTITTYNQKGYTYFKWD